MLADGDNNMLEMRHACTGADISVIRNLPIQLHGLGASQRRVTRALRLSEGHLMTTYASNPDHRYAMRRHIPRTKSAEHDSPRQA
jgi:hypothetical protein